VPKYEANALRELLRTQKMATMPEMKAALGTHVRKTVQRKLKELPYTKSYSHNGMYYAHNRFVRFNKDGLWCHRCVWFSKHGSLLATLKYLITISESGQFAHELKKRLHVSVKESLLRLVNTGEIARVKVSGLFLYCSPDVSTRNNQVSVRHLTESKADDLSDEVKAAIIIFTSLLDEKQRRLYAGLEALRIGRGGDKQIAALLGLNSHTVSKGRKELLDRDIEIDGVRKKGAGRRSLEKKRRKFSPKSKS
jgi:hypothetical protein